MRGGWPLSLALGVLLGTGEPGDGIEAELSKFRGTWQQVSSRANGQDLPEDLIRAIAVTYAGDKKTVRSGGELVVQDVRIELDPEATPKRVDEKAGAVVVRGIYKVEGDTLTNCIGPEGGERPTEFASTPGSRQTLQVFRRLKFAGGAQEGPGKPLEVPGVATIDAPGEGFVWADVRAIEAPGRQGRIYACTKEGTTDSAVLTVMNLLDRTDGASITAIKAHYNGLVKSLRDGGFTELGGSRPVLQPPIPDRVEFSMTGTRPDGQRAFIGAAAVFGKNLYTVLVVAGTQRDCERRSQDRGEPQRDPVMHAELAKLGA